MTLTSANLVGYLRAEFAKASELRGWLFFLQLMAAVPTAIAVLLPDHYGDALYWLAIASAVLLIIWWYVNGRYTRIRSAAQAARRGALLLGGLNEPLSAGEIEALRERFTVSGLKA
jgi:cyanate permease